MSIHVIGDSHTGVFRTYGEIIDETHRAERDIVPFIKCEINGATAYHLKDEHSSTNSSIKLRELLDKVDKKNDLVLMWFGEIDCRLHIAQQAVKQDKSMLEMIENTIDNYTVVLDMLRDEGFMFAVIGVPACNREVTFSTDEIQYMIYSNYNMMLSVRCAERKYPFIDVMAIAQDSFGFMKEQFVRGTDCMIFSPTSQINPNDKTHFNHLIVPYIISKLQEIFNANIYIGIGRLVNDEG
jgi:hypothetical protein